MFTQGKWEFTSNKHIDSDTGARIADIYNSAPGYIDNGILIAASPDMYEALKDMMKMYDTIRQFKPFLFNMLNKDDERLYHICQEYCIATEAALAKAEGKGV